MMRFALAFALILGLGLGVQIAQAETLANRSNGVSEGYLFLDGNYLDPPYLIDLDDKTLTINGHEFHSKDFDLSAFAENEPKGFHGRPGGWSRRSMMVNRNAPFARGRWGRSSSLELLLRELKELKTGSIAVLYSGKAPLIVHPMFGRDEVLVRLTGKEIDGVHEEGLNRYLTPETTETWGQLTESFTPTNAFLSRAGNDLQRIEEATAQGKKVVAANLLAERVSYPLTVFGMLIVVLGCGHLMSNRPQVELQVADDSTQKQFAFRTLLIIGLLSGLDLAWTLLASNAGAMRELNPLGSRLIQDPVTLVAFKLSLTLSSLAILYYLHRLPIARLASWWCCLVLMLLTARWIVFQSMFV